MSTTARKATKTHDAPSEIDAESLTSGDLVLMEWHSQDNPVWLRFLGFSRVVAEGAPLLLTVLPPAKDERAAVTFPIPERVQVMKRKVPSEQLKVDDT